MLIRIYIINIRLSETQNHKSILLGDGFLVFKRQRPDTTYENIKTATIIILNNNENITRVKVTDYF